MARNWFEAQAAQYKHAAAQGDGLAVWDGGVKCYLPSATLYGACRQDGTPAPDAPAPIAHGGSNFRLFGGNLLYPNGSGTTTQLGVTRTYLEDGSLVLSGTPTSSLGIMWYGPWTNVEIIPPAGRYAFVNHDTTTAHTASYLVQCFDAVTRAHIKNVTATAANPYITLDKPYVIRVALNFWNTAYELKNERYLMQFCPVGADGTIPPYAPYFDGGSVTAPALYAIPDTDYRDEWNAVTGQGVRWCHALTFDGTEEWGAAFPDTADSHTFYLTLPHPAAAARCSHFPVGRLDADPAAAVLDISFAAGYLFINHPSVAANDVEAFKTWLAQQSAAGTPVTVVYAALNSGLTDVVAEPFTHRPDVRLMQPDGCAQLIQTGGGAVSPLSITYVTHC